MFFPWGPGGFRELQGSGRSHFNVSWYLSGAVVTIYGQKHYERILSMLGVGFRRCSVLDAGIARSIHNYDSTRYVTIYATYEV